MRPCRMENSAKLNEKDVFDIRETSLLRHVLQNVNGERENVNGVREPCRICLNSGDRLEIGGGVGCAQSFRGEMRMRTG